MKSMPSKLACFAQIIVGVQVFFIIAITSAIYFNVKARGHIATTEFQKPKTAQSSTQPTFQPTSLPTNGRPTTSFPVLTSPPPQMGYILNDILVRMSPSCPETGAGSAAPRNYKEFDHILRMASEMISNSVKLFKLNPSASSKMDAAGSEIINKVMIHTVIDKETAKNSFHHFLRSVSSVDPPLNHILLVVCLDEDALTTCNNIHRPQLCIYMSLAMRFSSSHNPSHTLARIYTALRINALGWSALAVDVNTIFLHNPLLATGPIGRFPHSFAVMQDAKPFDINTNDESVVNAGFLFFPATNSKTSHESGLLLNEMWGLSCLPGFDVDQVVTQVLRRTQLASLAGGDIFTVNLLPKSSFVSFCNTNCGNTWFSSIQSLHDLEEMDRRIRGKAPYHACEAERRREWVFFHTACMKWPSEAAAEVAVGRVQQALHEWLTQSPRSGSAADVSQPQSIVKPNLMLNRIRNERPLTRRSIRMGAP